MENSFLRRLIAYWEAHARAKANIYLRELPDHTLRDLGIDRSQLRPTHGEPEGPVQRERRTRISAFY
jgi:hypothetical protein